MAKNIPEIPYTELVERTSLISRLPGNTIGKARGVVQDVYAREITAKYDWQFLIAESSITTTAEYKTGTITATTGSTIATFSSDATLTSAFTGRRAKIYSNDVVYDVTFSNTTAVTLAPSFRGPSNISNGAYTIFQPFYVLAKDFDRFLKDGGIDKWVGGKRELIAEQTWHRFRTDPQNYGTSQISTPGVPETLRLHSLNTAGQQVIEVAPPPKDDRNYVYSYIRKLNPLVDSSAGTVTISANATTVTGSTSCRFSEMQTGDWLRVDAFGTGQDSSWYRIIAIAHNSSLTLATSFANTGVTSTVYTISRAPEMPSRMHPAVLFGSLRNILLDQGDETAAYYNLKMAEVLSDGKRIYVTRPYSQDVETIAEDYNYRR